MAKSTGLVLAAGGLTLTDLAVTGWDNTRAVKTAAATVLAAFAAAGLDAVIPGLGFGTAVVLVAAVVYKSGPRIAAALNLAPVPTGDPNNPVIASLRG